jgi:hypothetical protein
MNQGITILFILLGYALGAAILGYVLSWIIRVAVTHGIRAARQQAPSGDDAVDPTHTRSIPTG